MGTLGQKGVEGTEGAGEASGSCERSHCEKAKYTYASEDAGNGSNTGSSVCSPL